MVYPTNKIIPLYLLSINRLGRCANMYMAAEKHIIQIISNRDAKGGGNPVSLNE